MSTKVTLYDLLGVNTSKYPAKAAAKLWPGSRIKGATGIEPFSADEYGLLDYLNSSLEFWNIIPGASDQRVGLYAEIHIKPFTEQPIVLTQMPNIAFYLQPTSSSQPARLFVTHGDTGTEVIVEALPVEIQVPSDLLGSLPPSTTAEGTFEVKQTEDFKPGQYDSLQVTLRNVKASSIYVHVRIRMTEEMDCIIEPSVPISIGPCRFFGLPCRGLHYVNFVPSPRLQGDHDAGEQALEWTRHDLDRWALSAEYAGVLTVRTIDLDTTYEPFKWLIEKMNANSNNGPLVEFVLEDIALFLANIPALPLPLISHGLCGLRKNVEAEKTPEDPYSFDENPLKIKIFDDKTLFIRKCFLRTPMSIDETFIFVEAGLTLLKGWGKTWAATFTVTDEWTVALGIQVYPPLELFTIADSTVKVAALKVGFSVKKLSQEDSFGNLFLCLFDLTLSSKATTLFGGAFKMRSLSGKELNVAIRDVGWNLGSFSFGSSADLPEGVNLIFGDCVCLSIEEIGWVAENNGGRYLSFSGGIAGILGWGNTNTPEKGFETGIRFRRLRFRTGGNPNAPAWLMDGVSLLIKWGNVSITGFGMISEFSDDTGHQYKELGFGIQVAFNAIGLSFLIGMQLFYGRVQGPVDNYTYWMFGFQVSPIPCGTFLLVNIRMLLAGNMVPNLPEPDGYDRNMRLFRWYKGDQDAIKMPEANRRLSGWTRKNDAFAMGIGLGLALPVGDIFVLDGFVFWHDSDDENGLLIALEVYMFNSSESREPVGYGALEFDFARDKWGFMLGVTVTPESVLGKSLPFSNSVSLTGNLYAGNKPGTFALGQLNDQSTWLTLRMGSPWMGLQATVGLCFQWVDAPDGPQGVGFVMSISAGSSFGIGLLQLYGSFGIVAGVWRNESTSSGCTIDIQAGIRIKLFWIFTFGLSISIELDHLDSEPSYTRLGFKLTIETPWFLPDVTFRFEEIWNSPQIEAVSVVSTPLTSANASPPSARTQSDLAVTPLRGFAIEEHHVYSMKDLRKPGAATLAEDIILRGQTPVGVDSTIALNFKPAMDNNTTVVELVDNAASSVQHSEDLTTRYELKDISIERKPRFGPHAHPWTTLLAPGNTLLESPSDFLQDDQLEVRFQSSVKLSWDKDYLREGKLELRRLLINAETDYSFLTTNPEADDTLARNDPTWPCRPKNGSADIAWHEIDYANAPCGVRVSPHQRFTESSSTLHWLGGKPPVVAQGRASSPHAARLDFARRENGRFAMISFDEPVFVCEIFADWPGEVSTSVLILNIYAGLHRIDQRRISLSVPPPVATPVRIENTQGITSCALYYEKGPLTGQHEDLDWIEFARFRYRTLEEEVEQRANEERFKARKNLGGGTLAWLPNHDYKVRVTTRVILKHETQGQQDVELKQVSYFKTKGLPGLNAVSHIGEELEPYVESMYPGAAPHTLYRREAVALAFNEKFNTLLPVDRVPSPDNPAERNQILEWVLAVKEENGQRVSQTRADWITAHRKVPLQIELSKSQLVDEKYLQKLERQAMTLDPFVMRYEAMLLRPEGCNVTEPPLHRSQVLVHQPVDPEDLVNGQQFWKANTFFRVDVRRKNGPCLERTSFIEYDHTAFDVRDENSPTGTPWSCTDGTMHVQGSSGDEIRHYAIFGDSDWNHIQIHATVDPQQGTAGVAVGVAGTPAVNRGLLALIDEKARQLLIVEKRGSKTSTLAQKALPTDAKAPYALSVYAFDDTLRACTADIEVEAARNDIREGRLALVAQNGGTFESLVVEPLDAYRFYFQSSRFVDFKDHIQSFDGSVIELSFEGSVASLLSSTDADFHSAMSENSDPEKRQRLFDSWVQQLALPLTHTIDRLKISRVSGASGPELLLLESPEPLQFSRDVTLTVEEQVRVPVISQSSNGKTPVGDKLGSADIIDSLRLPRPDVLTHQQQLSDIAAGLDFRDDRVSGMVQDTAASRELANARWLVRAVEHDDIFEYEVYSVDFHTRSRGKNLLAGEVVEVIRPRQATMDSRKNVVSMVAGDFGDMAAGDMIFLDVSGQKIGGIRPMYETKYEKVPVRILTNGNETRALIIPVTPGGRDVKPFSKTGTFRFNFTLDRARYRCSNPDSTSNYRDAVAVLASWQ